MQQFLVRSLHGKSTLGNLTLVSVSDPYCREYSGYAEQSRQQPEWVHAQLMIGNGFAKVTYYQNGHLILNCGSGNLAVARVLEESGSFFHCITVNGHNTLSIGKTEHPGQYYYCDSPLSFRPLKYRSAWSRIVGHRIAEGHYIGGSHDYCLLCIAGNPPLGKLNIHAKALCVLGYRALILTSTSRKSCYDYEIRYFAPQYGRSEDQATGSANIQAATYWQKTLRKTTVTALQVSKHKGECNISRHNGTQTLYGNAEIIDCF